VKQTPNQKQLQQSNNDLMDFVAKTGEFKKLSA
jgi:hypothetical protein